MRNMSFFLTTEQVRNKTKTVTRRIGWKSIKDGELIQAVKKCQGLKKGEKIERLHVIRVIHANREPLYDITSAEVEREGFGLASPTPLTPAEFVQMFCRYNKCTMHQQVTRIEFNYV